MTTTPTTPISPAIYCRHCNYDLRATPPDSPRCPECGRVFDPSNPRTFRRRPRRRWMRHVKRAAYAVLSLVLILAAAWLWLFWGWYDEQQALKAIPAAWSNAKPLSPWLREHAGFPGFVLDRTDCVTVDADIAGPVGLAPVARLKRLDTLYLRGRAITDLRLLAGCTHLRALLFSDTGVTDLTLLPELPTVEVLDLPSVTTDLRPLAGRSSLQFVLLPFETTTEEQVKELRRMLPGCSVGRQ